MDRKEFLKATGCVCAMLGVGTIGSRGSAQDEAGSPDDETASGPKKKPHPNQPLITGWTEEMMVTLDAHVEEETRAKIMETCGRGCARRTYGPNMKRLTGDLDALLREAEAAWARSATFDEETGVVHIVGRPSATCGCPLVEGRGELASATLCSCSRGWMKEVFETVTGAHAEVKLESSVLTGGECCSFRIALT